MSSINTLISANGACGLRRSAEKEGRSRKDMQEGEGEDECEYKVVTTEVCVPDYQPVAAGEMPSLPPLHSQVSAAGDHTSHEIYALSLCIMCAYMNCMFS